MKIICISDIHTLKPTKRFPKGDILIIAGDICDRGTINDVIKFNIFLNSLKYKYKILVAGNHDVIFEENKSLAMTFLSNVVYLQDSWLILNDFKIYGSPWQPEFFDWAFNLPRGKKLKEKWDMIPIDTDILITHSPPYGILDKINKDSENLGCEELLKVVMKIKPKLHVFGHIHGGHGILEKTWNDGKKTIFVNASICNEKYKPVNKPIKVEL